MKTENGILTTKPSGFTKAGFEFGKGIQHAIIEVTPLIAQNWLNRNKTNRPVNPKNLKFLCSEINNNRWVYNGEAIKFDKDGNLLDGQHRLEAISATGKTLSLSVIFGLENESFSTIDTGKGRSSADALAVLGYKNYSALSAASRFILVFNRNTAKTAAHGTSGKMAKLSNQQIIDFVKDNPDIEKCTNISVKMRSANKARFINIRLISALMFLFAQKHNYKLAHEFFNKLLSGDNISGGDPIKILRQKLLLNAMEGRQEKMKQSYIVAVTIKAWNLWVQGKECKLLRYKSTENFPVIK